MSGVCRFRFKKPGVICELMVCNNVGLRVLQPRTATECGPRFKAHAKSKRPHVAKNACPYICYHDREILAGLARPLYAHFSYSPNTHLNNFIINA
jgi:hypothetical protein